MTYDDRRFDSLKKEVREFVLDPKRSQYIIWHPLAVLTALVVSRCVFFLSQETGASFNAALFLSSIAAFLTLTALHGACGMKVVAAIIAALAPTILIVGFVLMKNADWSDRAIAFVLLPIAVISLLVFCSFMHLVAKVQEQEGR